MIDWNRNGMCDPVDVGIDIAVQSAASNQEMYVKKMVSDTIRKASKKSPLSRLLNRIKESNSKMK